MEADQDGLLYCTAPETHTVADNVAETSQESGAPDTVAELRAAAKAVISDVQAMQQPSRDWFGNFSDWTYEYDGPGTEYVAVEWPNLAISAARLAKALDGAV